MNKALGGIQQAKGTLDNATLCGGDQLHLALSGMRPSASLSVCK